ncbi:hypothetical protein [Chelativorans salis]|uniref:Uncharacterized protein n=1 Tax=Chelativorans salis TaxID=2978478 RepID=A0ABT2LYP8_9HYPH|nr:hypothetical protein [Chelativorans sp. EGI FJ00035]MCT7378528.1 hypothetical protein [Chelativorans sp. EGI FJ00035]
MVAMSSPVRRTGEALVGHPKHEEAEADLADDPGHPMKSDRDKAVAVSPVAKHETWLMPAD